MKKILAMGLIFLVMVSFGTAAMGREIGIRAEEQQAMDTLTALLQQKGVPLGTLEKESETAEDGSTNVLCSLVPGGILWLTYWEDGTVEICMRLMADSQVLGQTDTIFTAFLTSFLPRLDESGAAGHWEELKAAVTEAAEGEMRTASLEYEGYSLLYLQGEWGTDLFLYQE